MSVFLQFAILGLLQALTEFLPVSSSGHLFLLSKYFNIEESLFISIILHIATLLSIFVVMRKELWTLIKHPFSKEMRNLVISSVATFLIVILFYDFVKSLSLENYVPFFFMLTACVLIVTDLFATKKAKTKELNKKQSLIMGIAQGIAVFPGLSRSGSTICAGVFAGANKEKVAKHSFLMSVPIILASLVMEIVELGKTGIASVPIHPLILGFLVAFIVGIFSLRFMIKVTCKVRFRYFAYYLIFISLILLFV